MLKNIYIFLILVSSYLLVQSQDCFLTVPNDPLNTGLFVPWFVSTNPTSQLNCSQLIKGSEVFVEATIFDIDNNNFFVYYPLVIDIDTVPAIQPEVAPLPPNNVVVIHVGINGDTVTLLPTIKYNINSIDTGNCINGLPNGSVFGQFAYCNGLNFFQVVNQHINNGSLTIPPILNSVFGGDVCPTTRSFPIVDQDQSDNVLSQYIITQDLKLAQDTPLNRNNLQVLKIISNGSDNRLLNIFVNPAIGCQSFTAYNLVDNYIKQSSVALNEIQANLTPITETTALVPPFSPFVVDNDNNAAQSVLKTNLYRDGVNQPNIIVVDNNDNINYCNQMGNLTPPFFIKHMNQLRNMDSPAVDIANNLLNFMSLRFQNAWEILDCKNLIGIPSPITAIIDPNTGIAISNNLLQQPTNTPTTNCYTTTLPSFSSGQLLVQTTDEIIPSVSSTYIQINSTLPTNFPSFKCGNSAGNINCLELCTTCLDLECTTPGFTCYNIDNNPFNCNVFNFCGDTFNTLKCDNPCPLGFDIECKTQGDICFKDMSFMCNNNQTITTSKPTITIVTTSDSSNNNTITSTSDNTISTSSLRNKTTTNSPIANSSENISKKYITPFYFLFFLYIFL